MQLYEGKENRYWGKEEELLKTKKIIGLGDWHNDKGEDNYQINKFKEAMNIGDIVLVRAGGDKIALVEVISDAYYSENTDELSWFQNRRDINILEVLNKRINGFPATMGTLQRLTDKNKKSYRVINNWYRKIKKEKLMKEKINLLKNRKQIILQGPPGTGKTRLAKQMARYIIKEEIEVKIDDIKEQVKLIQFHPSYSYEDFVRGIVADSSIGSITYKTENKILAQMAKKALEDKEKNYILIIDEINRANLSSVLGELIYALEYRDEVVESMYALEDGTREITLPSNLYIIGTMNTADRSVGHIDYAIRRRFAFESILPDKEAINLDYGKQLFKKVLEIFNDISPEFDKNDVMLGHSYFIANNKDELEEKLKYQIKPLLDEYVKDGVLNENAKDKIDTLSL